MKLNGDRNLKSTILLSSGNLNFTLMIRIFFIVQPPFQIPVKIFFPKGGMPETSREEESSFCLLSINNLLKDGLRVLRFFRLKNYVFSGRS